MMPPFVTRNSFTEESHPWEFHIPQNADKLLLGTFPSEEKNRKQPFFYCSQTNRFWDVLARVADTQVSALSAETAIKGRQDILSALRLGLTDMGKIVLRQRDSSNDHSLFPIEFMDIIQLVNDHPGIRTLIVSGDLDGNSSLSWFGTYCSLNKVTIKLRELKDTRRTTVHIVDREISVLLGYSTSGNSRKTTEVLIQTYKSILL